MGFIYKWIRNIVSVMIFVSFIEILMPEGKMKKYLNLILGFLVMIVIINPIINLLNSKDVLEKEYFKISALLSEEECKMTVKNIESLQREQLINIYKSKLKDDIKTRIERKYSVKVLNVDMDLEEDREKFGKIRKLYILLSNDKKNMSDKETVSIIKINVNGEEENNNLNSKNDSLKKEIRCDITDIYNIDNLDIIIN
ncbi:stage III sporulation protein AF [Caminicella sporogenes DSM 14501]|uniref:Stage III sporulation protein AF n=1 Tax=Caminicella sporogenes DSM 14501 TaxID=1121266 RepID=A0A1M6LM50_9FIRM|nr:stage III sporulation protein AF [Caminicella sporogenes]RKD27879.1 stage III sporulation protein AF [Caminicella sporogenes]WIF94535.1 stage III sporulation protein AF [Caminicella sporogenes]SHJ72277.1 stage III sporulation protein AF [Caminicella sporogenes DSM 14501]